MLVIVVPITQVVFSNVFMRAAAQQCPICHCKYDRDMLASASGIAYERTLAVFGGAHTTTRVRQVEHATPDQFSWIS